MPYRVSAAAACLLGLAACKSAYPAPDYDRAVEEIRSVTGAENVFHPGTAPAAREERVTELLQDGLGLSEAVELGLLNNPALQASFHDVGMAHADRVQASLLTNPSLSAVLRFPTSGGGTEFEGGLFGNLLDIWQMPKRERIAESALQRRILELAHQAALLASDIRVAYVETTSSDRLLEIAGENRESARQLSELAEARLEAAAGTVIDANLARLEFLETKVALRDAELAAGEARRTLLALLGLGPQDRGPRLVELSDDGPPPLPSLGELKALALARRLDVRAAHEAVHQATAEVERQRGLFVRTVDVGVAAEKDGDWSVGPGVRLELPIFDQNQAQEAKALETLSKREMVLVAIRLAATQEVSSALARAEASWDALTIYREDILSRSEETLTQARESYQLGKTTILPALEAQRQLLAARSAYARRLLQAATALSDLERATGTPRERLLTRHVEEEGR
jgi:cobalt-zinc-cadmium efflux system outer membrane protein